MPRLTIFHLSPLSAPLTFSHASCTTKKGQRAKGWVSLSLASMLPCCHLLRFVDKTVSDPPAMIPMSRCTARSRFRSPGRQLFFSVSAIAILTATPRPFRRVTVCNLRFLLLGLSTNFDFRSTQEGNRLPALFRLLLFEPRNTKRPEVGKENGVAGGETYSRWLDNRQTILGQQRASETSETSKTSAFYYFRGPIVYSYFTEKPDPTRTRVR